MLSEKSPVDTCHLENLSKWPGQLDEPTKLTQRIGNRSLRQQFLILQISYYFLPIRRVTKGFLSENSFSNVHPSLLKSSHIPRP